MDSVQLAELLPGLPEELALECLTRLHYSAHSVASLVCRRWREILLSREFYYHRKKTGHTHKAACLVHARPVPSDSKPVGQPSYGVSMFDPVSGDWAWVDPIPKYRNGLPMFCQIVSTEGKLVVMGGWDPENWDPVKDIFVYDFATRGWTRCSDMPSKRSFFAVGAADGRVFVAGGHDESKNALSSAWVFDIRRNEWAELPRMAEERDECEGVVIGSEFWVVSGYDTESQGRFKSSAESMELSSGEWKRVDDAWGANRCPRACVGIGKDGNLLCWAESDPEIRVGACGIDLGEMTIVTGAAYQGAPHGFFFTGGQNGKLLKIDVPDEFLGFVQSGCAVEI
nr:F-box/kelch-repeat protein At1g15670-like [Ipomoea batatas]